MNALEIFNRGTVLEQYSYINPDDLDGEYIGFLVTLDKKVYEIIKDMRGNILDSEYLPRLVTDDVDSMYEEHDYSDEEPQINYTMESGTKLQDWKVMVDMFSPVSK